MFCQTIFSKNNLHVHSYTKYAVLQIWSVLYLFSDKVTCFHDFIYDKVLCYYHLYYDDWSFCQLACVFLLFLIKVHVMCDGCDMPNRRCLLLEHLISHSFEMAQSLHQFCLCPLSIIVVHVKHVLRPLTIYCTGCVDSKNLHLSYCSK